MAVEYNMDKFENPDDWIILFSISLQKYIYVYGHRVKRITYLYHKPSKTIEYMGKICVKKYGIYISMTNNILLDVIKENYELINWDINMSVRSKIQSLYLGYMTYTQSDNVDYIGVVLPFRRLLTDVCDLVSEYGFDLVDLLTEVERDVESLNYTTRHQMVDEHESLCDTISEIPSDEDISTIDSDHLEYTMESSGLSVTYSDEVIKESSDSVSVRSSDCVSGRFIYLPLPLESSQIYKKWNIISENGIHILERNIHSRNDKYCIKNGDCWCEFRYRVERLKRDILEVKGEMEITSQATKELLNKIKILQIKTATLL